MRRSSASLEALEHFANPAILKADDPRAVETVARRPAVAPAHAHRSAELLQHVGTSRADADSLLRATADDRSGVARFPRDAIGFEIHVRTAGRRLRLGGIVAAEVVPPLAERHAGQAADVRVRLTGDD